MGIMVNIASSRATIKPVRIIRPTAMKIPPMVGLIHREAFIMLFFIFILVFCDANDMARIGVEVPIENNSIIVAA